MNKINLRNQSNSKLLSLLSKRKQAATIFHSSNQWPGRLRPSFASSLPINPTPLTYSAKSHSQKRIKGQSSRVAINIPRISDSTKSLTLKSHPQLTADVLTILQKHKTANLEMEIGGKSDPLFKSGKLAQRDIIVLNSGSTSRENESQYPKGKDLQGYVIDYITFNYLNKVLDNPEMWSKFVYRKSL